MSNTLLKRTRFNRGLSQEALGQMAGVSGETIRRLEAGANPHPATALKVAAALDCKPTDLFLLDDIDTELPEAS